MIFSFGDPGGITSTLTVTCAFPPLELIVRYAKLGPSGRWLVSTVTLFGRWGSLGSIVALLVCTARHFVLPASAVTDQLSSCPPVLLMLNGRVSFTLRSNSPKSSVKGVTISVGGFRTCGGVSVSAPLMKRKPTTLAMMTALTTAMVTKMSMGLRRREAGCIQDPLSIGGGFGS